MRLFLLILAAISFSSANPTSRIIGGRDALAGEAPYQVSIRQFGSITHICGGALISSVFVVTSASCVFQQQVASLNIVAGAIFLTQGTGIRSVNIIKHFSFNPVTMNHNIALVQLATPFALSAAINVAFLTSTEVRGEVNAVFTGFGSTFNCIAGPNANTLQLLEVTTATDEACARSSANITVEFNLCTNNPRDRGFCTTDKGGPLVANSQLIGIANLPRASDGMDVYTRIFPYREWIRSITRV